MSKYNFPKVDLHLHLDGSFRTTTLLELAEKQGVTLPGETLEGYEKFIYDCSNADSVNDYLKMFEHPLLVMQDSDSIVRITKELIIDLNSTGVRYAEIRFAPQLHTQKSLSQSQAVEAVLKGREEGLKECPNIKINIILCMMSVGPETVNWDANMETVEVCRKYAAEEGVVSIDLAGGEGIVPLSNFGPLFKKAKEYGLNMTCHAGDSQDYHTVKDALDFSVTRVGHGHHIYEDPELCRYAAAHNIALEICPTSNVQCKTRSSYAKHPAKNLLEMGIPVTINTDNMTLARVCLDDEYDHCLSEMGFEEKDLIRMNINSVKASFLKKEDKEQLIAELKSFL